MAALRAGGRLAALGGRGRSLALAGMAARLRLAGGNSPCDTVLLLIGIAWLVTVQPVDAAPHEHRFVASVPAEALATVTVDCGRCDWGREGREAVVLRVTLDGQYVQHVPVARTGRAAYRLMLGAVAAGPHVLALAEDAALTARDLGGEAVQVERVEIEQIAESSPHFEPVSRAPFVYARADTVGRFTDVPMFMWYEIETTTRGRRYRYSLVFTNEDGGTPADRLMATWGRTTDIEYVYSVEVDGNGRVMEEDIQGPKHEILPFRGTREARHPLLWVSTDNNMVLPAGSTSVRYAPAPVAFPLSGVSREAVMDAHPWLYQVAAQELIREGKIVADAPPGRGHIPDPRRFVYLEGCGTLNGAALAFAIRVNGTWLSSDRGVSEYRIARDGCFRAAVPVPSSVGASDIQAVRAQAHTRKSSSAPSPAEPVTLTRLNRVFMLGQEFTPQPSTMKWNGAITLTPDGPPVAIVTR